MTDVESSTGHLRSLGQEYGDVLALHHGVLREVVAEEGGLEAGCEGDSLCVVFAECSSALRAAVSAQRRLIETDWPDSPWRDRMAVHSGDVVLGESGAVGMALHEAARVRSVAHGGQIVVTEVARASTVEAVSPDVDFVDLGFHSVRDFPTAVRLYQVRAVGLPIDFPALRTMASKSVPMARTSFVGRVSELDDLLTRIEDARIVTVTGPGGCGKTRMAYEAARRADFGRIVVVELAGIREDSQVAIEVASAVGARRPEEITDAVGAGALLLVLDNCEHVIEAVGWLVSRLCDSCPAAVVLATSREPLGIAGEVVCQVPRLEMDDARALFRARAVDPGDGELVTVACERLGRMPLAIELAAARVRSMTLAALVDRLDDQLGLLTTGSRDVPRQQTLRATLEWSHQLLTPPERAVFRRLAVFAGGFSLDAAEAVTRHANENVVRVLDGLVAKSVVDLSPSRDRYGLLEPVRQFALEQLTLADERDMIEEAHLHWATLLARQANRKLFADQRKWTDVLDRERDNMAAAISWALSNEQPSAACTIVSNLAWYWFTSARIDSFVWIPRLLEQLDLLTPRDRAKALLAAGMIYSDDHSDERPLAWLSEAESIFRSVGNRRTLGATLFWLGRAQAGRSRFETAAAVFDEALAIHEEGGDLFGVGWCLTWTGALARHRNDLDADEQIQTRVLEICETVPHVAAQAWRELSLVAAERGDLTLANHRITHAVELYRQLGDRWQLGIAIANQADYLLDANPNAAAGHTIEALRILRDLGAGPDLGFVLLTAAELLLQDGRPAKAATILGAVYENIEPAIQHRPFRAPTLRGLRFLRHETGYERELGIGQRLGVRGATDAAIGWLAATGRGQSAAGTAPRRQPT
jgi:predicted ATPase/class 3 adenylate cyclase